MAFDGITIANIVYELNKELIGGRMYKIAQPENDELLLTIKTSNGQKRLFLSADASLPLIYLTSSNKQSPMTAPNFCMLLRKHLQNGRIVGITQPGLERVIRIDIEHLDEMGDLCHKALIIEIMGKHSNIIFVNENDCIIDSIKHVSAAVSSVREVLPGKPYFIANTQDKSDILTVNQDTFIERMASKNQPLFKAIYTNFTGLSPVFAQELCYRASLDGDQSTAAFTQTDLGKLYAVVHQTAEAIKEGSFAPVVAYSGKKIKEYAAFPLTMYQDGEDHLTSYPTMSELLEFFYAEKNAQTRIHQKSADLRHVVQTILERDIKKYDLQINQIKDTEKRETYRIYGELLNTYGYNIAPGDKVLEAVNYYTNEPVSIPLDPTLTGKENAQRYFDKYTKMKRTFEALSTLTKEVHDEIEHLESIATALDIAIGEEDLTQIRQEMAAYGFIRKKSSGKKEKIVSKPFHYISSDGFHMYVGKNNFQNDELTFKFATGNDWWFHAKKIPGSHVVVKLGNAQELPDRTFEEAARLAAYYSKGRDQEKVEIDYIQKKHVKKPAAAAPGFVVYYTNYSMMIDPDISEIEKVND